MRGASTADIAKMQERLHEAVAKSGQLEQTLSIAMEAAGESLYSTDDLSDEAMGEVAEAMQTAAAGDEAKALDGRIDAAIAEIEKQMRKETGA